ncbi:MAG: Germination-specific N-acetylmuramoyl-L-alanine amidase, partial [Dehalococcoidia bacterium]|nr:Germination-specific N-acetylmuramoyl-L-alanine amidase [Dehalococcoidia bacterium]
YSDTGDHHLNNKTLAQRLLDALLEGVRSAGYSPVNRGIRSDKYKVEYLPFTHFYGFDRTCSECTRLMTLGNNPMSKNRGQWTAGALVEVVFLSNPQDVQFLQRPDAVDIIARGLAQGILNYFGEQQ